MPKVGMEPIRRKQIIDATLRQIAEKGTDRLRLEDIARDCGVSKGIVSYYFGSKKNVVFEAFKSFLSYFHEVGEDCSCALDTLSAVLDLLFLSPAKGSGHDGLPSQVKRYLMLQIYAMANRDEEIGNLVRDFYGKYEKGIADILEWGSSNGEFRAMEPSEREELTSVIMAFLDGLIIRKLIEPASEEANRKLRAFAWMIIEGWLEPTAR